jgi:hypothetical protein
LRATKFLRNDIKDRGAPVRRFIAVERAADPLHCPGIDSELFGNDNNYRLLIPATAETANGEQVL